MSGRLWMELLITLGLLATIACLSLPISSQERMKNQLCVIEQDIYNAVQFAKNQALIQKNIVLLMPITDVSDWSSGIKVVIQNKRFNKILHQWLWRLPDLRISWTGFQSDKFILFSSHGLDFASNGRFLISLKSYSSVLMLNRLGRIRRDSYCLRKLAAKT